MGTRSRRRCITWIEYYLLIFRGCYQRRRSGQANLQRTISRSFSSLCKEIQPRSRFNQCPSNFCTTTDRNCCYYWFNVWTEYVSEAYLESASEHCTKFIWSPIIISRLLLDINAKLLRPLYGLADSCDYKHATFAVHLKKNLGILTVSGDMSLFFRQERRLLTGLLASYSNDTLACGDFILATDWSNL